MEAMACRELKFVNVANGPCVLCFSLSFGKLEIGNVKGEMEKPICPPLHACTDTVQNDSNTMA